MHRLNEDEFLAVDLSVMLGHHNITQLLLKIGAKDSPKCELFATVQHMLQNLCSKQEE